jgi:peptide/nickel transport system permease protein
MGSSLGYIIERLVTFLATIAISVTIVFVAPRLVPGDPLGAFFIKLSSVGGTAGGQALVEEYNRRFGLDKSILDQYISYLGQLLRGNLGYSISAFPTRVSTLLWRSLPWTVGLLTVTTIISWLVGSFLGAIVGWSGDRSRFLRAFVPVALLLYTTPYYILAILLIFLLAFHWQIFPYSGAYSVGAHPEWTLSFAQDALKHSVLPALSIILVSLGWWFLSMRSLIIAEQGQDYILWAEAKGLTRRKIFWRYAFRNALLPQTTGLALSFGNILGGALVMEAIFAYPGVGWLIYNGIKTSDFTVIQGSTLLIIIWVAAVNFTVDMLYPFIDPRIRLGGTQRS